MDVYNGSLQRDNGEDYYVRSLLFNNRTSYDVYSISATLRVAIQPDGRPGVCAILLLDSESAISLAVEPITYVTLDI